MKNILKKNQVIISAIAIMLIAAGYMNYTANTKDALEASALADTEAYAQLGDATLVFANVTDNTTIGTAISTNTENTENTENTGNTGNTENTEVTQTSSSSSDEYFTESRLEREKMYSQMLESYQNILENSQISETQKEISQNEIKNINDTKNAIMIAENLIKNKGFEDVVIFVNGESISVIIKGAEITPEQIAQIQNIVSRELSAEVDNIHISNKE